MIRRSEDARRRAALLAALLGASMLCLALVGPAAAQFAGGPAATTPATSFRVVASTPFGVSLVSWESPERFAARRGSRLSRRPFTVERGGTTIAGREKGFPGSVDRRRFAARPDGFSFSEDVAESTDFVLAQARAGRRTLVPTTVGGEPAWQTRFVLPANDCAGRPRSRVTLSLARGTLLPLRAVERAGARTRTSRYTYSAVNQDLPASDFATPLLGSRPLRVDHGFRRTGPAEAAAHLSYAPELPATLPPGFTLAVAGWAPRSGRTGAEGSVPARRELFAAVFRRGFERIDVTQRLAGRRGWESDPFAFECGSEYVERATVRGARGRYGIGPEIPPHLFWRQGRVLYTVSGPFPKRDLLAIARSLAPVP